MSFVGIASILAVAFLFSKNRKKVTAKLVFSALAMQFFLAFCILRTDIGRNLFAAFAHGFRVLYTFSDAGSAFIFGNLADVSGPWGVLFVVKVLPIIIFFGAFMAVLFHLGVVQFFVRIISFVIRPVLGTSGAETLCAAANSMMGPTEAPLLVKKYLAKMTESEIFLVMISGMATMSGSLLAVYGSMGVSMVHLLSASIMSIPGAILVAKILLPETGKPETMAGKSVAIKRDSNNVLDAVATGTSDGLRMAANVAAMLITFISLIALLNHMFGVVSSWAFGVSYTLDTIFSKLFSWVAFLIGVPMQDKAAAGTLLGQKLAINEFVAYANFVKTELTPRARAILTYALCGFSNFSVIGIQIGGIGALAPQQRKHLIKLGMRAVLGGTLANLLNAAIAGLFI